MAFVSPDLVLDGVTRLAGAEQRIVWWIALRNAVLDGATDGEYQAANGPDGS